MTVKEFDELVTAAKQGKRIFKVVKCHHIYESTKNEYDEIIHSEEVDFLNESMTDVINAGKSFDSLSNNVDPHYIEYTIAVKNECPDCCDYNDDGECTYCGTDPRECPKS